MSQNNSTTVNTEVWGKVKQPIDASVTLRGEGWVAVDPHGTGRVDGDLREGLIEIRVGKLKLQAGRQIFAWGRADRINPTDILASRDYRRLVVDDDENRLGQAAISISVPFAGGTVASHWVPEFRASLLPQDIRANGLPIFSSRPNDTGSYALRYERFGGVVDVALTLADALDRTPWLSLGTNGQVPTLVLHHPRIRMVGADLATTLGDFGVRVEMAHYAHNRAALQGLTSHTPKFAATIGVDRNFPGQWMVIAQAIVRISADTGPAAAGQKAMADRNAVIHGAWRKLITGATISVRKTFASDRGQAELTGAVLSGGGRYLQVMTSFAVNDDLRLQFLGEHFAGSAANYFGRQSANNVVMFGFRVGY